MDSVDKYFDHLDKEYGLTRIKYQKIIFAFDKDSFSDNHFNTAIQQAKARYPDCIVAWSNESFELWLLLHFNLVQSALPRQQYNSQLTKIFREAGILNGQQNYDRVGKTLDNIFDAITQAGGSLGVALKNAETLAKGNPYKANPAKSNPVTMVHKAVNALIKESKTT